MRKLRAILLGIVIAGVTSSCASVRSGEPGIAYRPATCAPDAVAERSFEIDPSQANSIKLPQNQPSARHFYHLVVPANAIVGVPGPVRITMRPLRQDTMGVEITARDASGSPVGESSYTKTMTLTMSREGCSESAKAMFVALHRGGNTWDPVPTSSSGNSVVGRLEHLSAYALAVP